MQLGQALGSSGPNERQQALVAQQLLDLRYRLRGCGVALLDTGCEGPEIGPIPPFRIKGNHVEVIFFALNGSNS